jgi:uncharacterized protein
MKILRHAILPVLLAVVTSFATACATSADDPTTGESSDQVVVRPTFDLWRDTTGFHFQLVASDGEVLVGSQAYASRTAALNGLLSVLANGGNADRYRLQTTAEGEPYFTLHAANRAVIASSDPYADETEARAAIDATIRAVAAYLQHRANVRGARFDVFEGRDRRFYFNLHARNGEIVLRSSQGYSTEAAALNGTFSVADHGTTAARYHVTQASDGRWYFTLVASNGQVIGISQMYSTKYNAQRGRDAVIALVPSVQLL